MWTHNIPPNSGHQFHLPMHQESNIPRSPSRGFAFISLARNCVTLPPPASREAESQILDFSGSINGKRPQKRERLSSEKIKTKLGISVGGRSPSSQDEERELNYCYNLLQQLHIFLLPSNFFFQTTCKSWNHNFGCNSNSATPHIGAWTYNFLTWEGTQIHCLLIETAHLVPGL